MRFRHFDTCGIVELDIWTQPELYFCGMLSRPIFETDDMHAPSNRASTWMDANIRAAMKAYAAAHHMTLYDCINDACLDWLKQKGATEFLRLANLDQESPTAEEEHHRERGD